MKIELVKGKRKWFFRVVSGNGKKLLSSQKYYSKWNAKRAARKLARLNGITYREATK